MRYCSLEEPYWMIPWILGIFFLITLVMAVGLYYGHGWLNIIARGVIIYCFVGFLFGIISGSLKVAFLCIILWLPMLLNEKIENWLKGYI